MEDVYFCPKMEANLLSTITLYDKGFEVAMKPGRGMGILKDNVIIVDTVIPPTLMQQSQK